MPCFRNVLFEFFPCNYEAILAFCILKLVDREKITFSDLTDLSFHNSNCMQEVQPEFTDAMPHHKMLSFSDFQKKSKTSPTTT